MSDCTPSCGHWAEMAELRELRAEINRLRAEIKNHDQWEWDCPNCGIHVTSQVIER